MTGYKKTVWADDQSPGINATNLNNIESGIYTVDQSRINDGIIHPHRMQGDAVQCIGVPAYIYPDWYNTGGGVWGRMQSNSPFVSFMVANPSNGPGASNNTDYDTGIQRATASGLRVLGYVDTNYTAVAAATVKSQIDSWMSWYKSYGLAGIFLDRADSTAANQPYYLDLYNYIKNYNTENMVVINPGIPNVDESYMQTCDILLNAESTPSGYTALTFPTWINNYPTKRFWHAIYSVPDTATRDSLLPTTKTNRAGYVMMTTGDSTWTSLPADPFWSGLISAVK